MSSTSKDMRLPLYCDKWDGSKSVAFTETFMPAFQAGAQAHTLKDDDHNIWEHLTGDDMQRDAAGAVVTPAPNTVAYKKLVKRANMGYLVCYQATSDVYLQKLIQTECNLPGNRLRKGYHAWQVLMRECSINDSDLHVLDARKEWQNATIENTVGYNELSITQFGRFLNVINARIPQNQQYSNDDLSLKVLSSIKFPESLATKAIREINARPGNREFERVGAGGQPERDFRAIIFNYSQWWESLFRLGTIRARPVGARTQQGVLMIDPGNIDLDDAGPDDGGDIDHMINAISRGKGGGRPFRPFRNGRGRGTGKGSGPHSDGAAKPPAPSSDRPRVCDSCWTAIAKAPYEKRIELARALLRNVNTVKLVDITGEGDNGEDDVDDEPEASNATDYRPTYDFGFDLDDGDDDDDEVNDLSAIMDDVVLESNDELVLESNDDPILKSTMRPCLRPDCLSCICNGCDDDDTVTLEPNESDCINMIMETIPDDYDPLCLVPINRSVPLRTVVGAVCSWRKRKVRDDGVAVQTENDDESEHANEQLARETFRDFHVRHDLPYDPSFYRHRCASFLKSDSEAWTFRYNRGYNTPVCAELARRDSRLYHLARAFTTLDVLRRRTCSSPSDCACDSDGEIIEHYPDPFAVSLLTQTSCIVMDHLSKRAYHIGMLRLPGFDPFGISIYPSAAAMALSATHYQPYSTGDNDVDEE